MIELIGALIWVLVVALALFIIGKILGVW